MMKSILNFSPLRRKVCRLISITNEPLGTGHPQFVPYASGSITDYHTYEIIRQTNQVSWLLDGQLVRTESRHVPTQPMNLHLNSWVPDSQ